MNKAGIPEIRDKISALCLQEQAVEAAYVFGSRAKGSTGSERDLDVALLLNSAHEPGFSLLSFMSSLERACGCRADVVILNHAGEILKHEVGNGWGCQVLTFDIIFLRRAHPIPSC